MNHPADRLVLRSQPHGDESFLGYLLRLAELNFYRCPRWILQLAKMANEQTRKVAFVFNDKLDLSSLSDLTYVDSDRMRSLLYSSAGVNGRFGNFFLFNNAIPSYLLRPSHPKVCPGCLRDVGHAKRIWDFALVTICPTHKQLLIDQCPVCNKQIAWARSSLYRCKCQSDWRDYSTQPLDESQLVVTRQVHRLCGLNSGGKLGTLTLVILFIRRTY